MGGNELSVAAGDRPATIDGTARKARFHHPGGLAKVHKGKSILVAERAGCTVRRLELGSGKLSTLCGAPGVCIALQGPLYLHTKT